MNNKPTLFAIIALLMMPGLAMAQSTITFDTFVRISDQSEATVTATLICNTGTPLDQVADISPGIGNNNKFIVEEFDLSDPAFGCEITISELPGYTILNALANGIGTQNKNDSCLFDTVSLNPPDTFDNLIVDNRCIFDLIPLPFKYTIHKDWDFDSDEGVDQFAMIKWHCNNTEDDISGSVYNTHGGTYFIDGTQNDEYVVDHLYANPDTSKYPTRCFAIETVFDSAIESDQGCFRKGGTVFGFPAEPKHCTIVNSVFFEGIPTLNQYGLAIMALLMLGVGFVGFRRFV